MSDSPRGKYGVHIDQKLFTLAQMEVVVVDGVLPDPIRAVLAVGGIAETIAIEAAGLVLPRGSALG